MNRKSLDKMAQVEEFLDAFAEDYVERGRIHFDEETVMSIHSYGAALANWEDDGRNSNSFFSTDSPVLLKCREKLQKEFGLPILTKDEGEDRERTLAQHMNVFRKDLSRFKN